MSSDRRYRRNTGTAAADVVVGEDTTVSPSELVSSAVLHCKASILRSLQGVSHRLAMRPTTTTSPTKKHHHNQQHQYGCSSVEAISAHLGPAIQEMNVAFDDLTEILNNTSATTTTTTTTDHHTKAAGHLVSGGNSTVPSRTGSVVGGGGGIRRVSAHPPSSPTHHHHHQQSATIKTLLDSNRALADQLAHHRQLADELALLMFNSQPEPSAVFQEMYHQSHNHRHHGGGGRSPTPPSSTTTPAASPASSPNSAAAASSPHRRHDNNHNNINTSSSSSSYVLEYVLHNTKRLQGQLREVFGTDEEGGPINTTTTSPSSSPSPPQQHPTSQSIEAFCRIAELSFTHAGESLLRQRMDAAGQGDAIDDSVKQITKGMQVELSRARQQLDDTRQDMTLMQRRHHDDMMRIEERSAEALRAQESKSKKVIAKLEAAIKAQADSSRDRLQKIWESVQLGVAEKLSDVRGRDLQRAQVMESLRATLEDERLGSEAAFVDTDALLQSPDINHNLRGGGSSALVAASTDGDVAGAAGGSSSPTTTGGGLVGGDVSQYQHQQQFDRPPHPVYDADPHAVWTGSPTAKTVSTLQQLLKEKSTELSIILAGSSAALRSRTLRWETELRGVVSQYESMLQGQGSTAYDTHIKELEETVATLRVELTNSKAKCIALDRQIQMDSSRMASALAASSSMSSAQRKSQLGSVSPLLSAAAGGGFEAPFISISSPHVTVVPKHTQTDLTGPVVSVAVVEAELRTLRLSGAVSGGGGDAFLNRRASLTFAPFPVDTSYRTGASSSSPSASTNNLNVTSSSPPTGILKTNTTASAASSTSSLQQQMSATVVGTSGRRSPPLPPPPAAPPSVVDVDASPSTPSKNDSPTTLTSSTTATPYTTTITSDNGLNDDVGVAAAGGGGGSRTSLSSRKAPPPPSLDVTLSHDHSGPHVKPTPPKKKGDGTSPTNKNNNNSIGATKTTTSITMTGGKQQQPRGNLTSKSHRSPAGGPAAGVSAKKGPATERGPGGAKSVSSLDDPPRPNTTPSYLPTSIRPLHPHPPSTNVKGDGGLYESADGSVGVTSDVVGVAEDDQHSIADGNAMEGGGDGGFGAVVSRHPSTSIPRGKPPQSPPRPSSTVGRGGTTSSARTVSSSSPSLVQHESNTTSSTSHHAVRQATSVHSTGGSCNTSNSTDGGGGVAGGANGVRGDAFSREGSPVGRFVTTPTDEVLLAMYPLSSTPTDDNGRTANNAAAGGMAEAERSRVQERQTELLRRHTIITSNSINNNTANNNYSPPSTTTSYTHTSRKTIQQEMKDTTGGSGGGGNLLSSPKQCSTIDDVLVEMLPRVLAPTRFYRTMCQLATTIDFMMTPPPGTASGKPSSTSNLSRLKPHVPRKLLLDATITITSINNPSSSSSNTNTTTNNNPSSPTTTIPTSSSVVPLLSLTTTSEYLIETGVQMIRRSIMSCEEIQAPHDGDVNDDGGIGGGVIIGRSTTSASSPPPLPQNIINLRGALRRDAATLEQMLVALVDLSEGEFRVPCTLQGVLEEHCHNDPAIASTEVSKWLLSGGGMGGGEKSGGGKPSNNNINTNPSPTTTTSPASTSTPLMVVPVSHAQRIVNGLIATLAQLSAVTTQVDKLDAALLKQHNDVTSNSSPTSSSPLNGGSLIASFMRPHIIGTAVVQPPHLNMRPGGGGGRAGGNNNSPPPLTISNKSVEVLVNDPARCARYIHEFVEANNARVTSTNRRSQHQQQQQQQ